MIPSFKEYFYTVFLENNNIFQKAIQEALPEIQDEYDSWTQDESGYDEELGSGGICDRISDILGGKFSGYGFDVVEGGQEGDDHSFIYVGKDGKAWAIDIPPYVYETGGGYSWKKKPNVIFSVDDVEIYEVDWNDVFSGQDEY